MSVLKKCAELVPFKNRKVWVKPNLLGPDPPETATCTHPSLVRATVEVLLDRGCEVWVGDSPATYPTPLKVLLDKSGIGPALKGLDVRWMEVDKLPPVRLPLRGLSGLKEVVVSEGLTRVDALVNLPKFKTHQLTGFTGAVKNFYGLVPRKAKKEYHARLTNPARFSALMVDLASSITERVPSFHLMDAITGMEGDGPKGGTPVEIGFLLCGANPFQVDHSAISIVTPDFKVRTDILAKKLGLMGAYETEGPLKQGWLNLKLPKAYKLVRLAGALPRLPGVTRLIAAPEILDTCTRCGTCVRNCPVDAITIKGHKAHIDRSKCIKCFTCAEVCPVNAVKVQKRLFNR